MSSVRRPLFSHWVITIGFAFVFLAPGWATAENDTTTTDGFQWKEVETDVGAALDLLRDGMPVLRYMYGFDDSTPDKAHATYKVYHHLFGPGTGQIITKGPGGKYTHHRGIYVGWNKTKTADGTFDFWHCRNGAHLRHIKFVEREAGEDSATMTAEIHWNDPEGKPVIRELRTVTVTPLQSEIGPAYQIDWSTQLESQRGKIQLDGDRQHAGFQFRAAQKIADTNGATYLRPEGFPETEKAVQVGDRGNPPAHINLGWFAMRYTLENTDYTIGYLEGKGQPEPSLYSERPYGRFGAFYKATIEEDEPLEMNYRLVVYQGQPGREELQGQYERFVKEAE